MTFIIRSVVRQFRARDWADMTPEEDACASLCMEQYNNPFVNKTKDTDLGVFTCKHLVGDQCATDRVGIWVCDNANNDVIVAFKGTDNMCDWITNNGLLVAANMYNTNLWTRTDRIVRSYRRNGHNMIFAGHSLGGFLASWHVENRETIHVFNAATGALNPFSGRFLELPVDYPNRYFHNIRGDIVSGGIFMGYQDRVYDPVPGIGDAHGIRNFVREVRLATDPPAPFEGSETDEAIESYLTSVASGHE